MHRAPLCIVVAFVVGQAAAAAPGVEVHYQLPTDGPLPQTYRVTLAITDARRPEAILSQFVCGQPCTVTTANGGRFTALWDGLDDNFMPLPAGRYGVKGLYMPARQWPRSEESPGREE